MIFETLFSQKLKPLHWPKLMNFLPVEVLYHVSLFLGQNAVKLLKISKQFNEVISSSIS
jgi:hypothetical protein